MGDEFDGPAGAPPNPALWTVAQRREMIKKPVFWDRPENMGQYRDDREHVFLDGNSHLVIRATRDPNGTNQSNTYTSGKVVGNFAAPINHTCCLMAVCAIQSWIGPEPSASIASTLSVSRMPISAKYSGSTMMCAPAAAASATRRVASSRFALTCGPDAIWIAATRKKD
jgi:hypothetical protein